MEWTFKGTDALRQALRDKIVLQALQRLHRVKRLKELEAPEQTIADTYRVLEKSIKDLGPRWEQVQEIYPEYRLWEKASSDFAEAWEDRCQHCAHIFKTDYDDDDLQSWCQKYTVITRTMPNPCPDFTDERN